MDRLAAGNGFSAFARVVAITWNSLMIEIRSLAYFTVACQHESLARSAAQLGIALSTLSASLKSLEHELGLDLFRRVSSGLCPTAAASWLLRATAPVLQAEAFVRRRLKSSTMTEGHLITLDLDLSYCIGRISKAIDRAAATMAVDDPDVLVEPRWIAEKGLVRPLADGWPGLKRSRVTVHAVQSGSATAPDDVVLLSDPWVLACRLPADTARLPSAAELFSGRLLVPALRQLLLHQATAYFSEQGIRGAQFMTEHPGALPRYIAENPDAVLFLPESVLSSRLGLLRVRTIAPDVPLLATIVARTEAADPVVTRFIDHLRAALNEPERVNVQPTVLSFRQIRCFNAIYRLRRVSAAAQAENMTQPALSEQLHKLESSLDASLFDRHRDGLIPTVLGDRFSPVAKVLEANLRDITGGGTTAFRPLGKRLTLGILPSVSQHGLLVNKIAEATLAVQSRYPALQIVVWEAPDATLQEWVTRGLIGVAVVETSLPHMARLTLGSSESLAVIANPRHQLLASGPVRLADVAPLPLALPTARSGLRQLFDAAARDQALAIRPLIEIDSLALTAAMLSRQPLCTVLPPSAVRREIEAGDLVAHPIIEPTIARRLFIIYSGDRSLTEPERNLVQLLRERLAEADSPAPNLMAMTGSGSRG
ncbi:MAG: LysR family transcriptional regulator [Gammaproteobacteria bacterium]